MCLRTSHVFSPTRPFWPSWSVNRNVGHCVRGGGTMGHIIALPYPKNLIALSTGKQRLNKFLLMDWNKKLDVFSFLRLVFEHKRML